MRLRTEPRHRRIRPYGWRLDKGGGYCHHDRHFVVDCPTDRVQCTAKRARMAAKKEIGRQLQY